MDAGPAVRKSDTCLLWRFTRDPAQCEGVGATGVRRGLFQSENVPRRRPFAPLAAQDRHPDRVPVLAGEGKGTPGDLLPEFDVLEEIEAAEEDRIDPAEAAAVPARLLSRLPPDNRLVLSSVTLRSAARRRSPSGSGWTRAK